jgi:hypothetical protein
MATKRRAEGEGAPSAERAAIIEQVLDGMTNGKTVAEVARSLKLAPGTVRRWLTEDEDTYRQYLRVRPMLGAAFAEEAIRVARESTSQTTAMDRVLIETLKWAAAKAAPMEYGEKQTVEHQGAQTIQVKVVEEDRPIRNLASAQDAVALSVVMQALDTVPMLNAAKAEDPEEAHEGV